MATRHRLENAGMGAVEYGSSGAQIGYAFGGPKGAAIGGAVGGFAGLLKGLMSDTEEQELIDRMKRGEIDEVQQRNIVRALRRRFYGLRQTQGLNMARRGLTDSSIAARLDAGLIRGEGEALAAQLAEISQENKGLGYDMMARRAAERQATVAAAAQGLGSVYLLERQNKQAADAERRHQEFVQTLSTITGKGGGGVSERPVAAQKRNATGGNSALSGKSNLRNQSYKGMKMLGERALYMPQIGG